MFNTSLGSIFKNMNGALEIDDDLYPAILKTIPDPPKILYWRGSLSKNIFDNCLSVVGSRKITAYGERVVEKIFFDLLPNTTVVSGFMYGVDSKAHVQALRRGLKTIAVLPFGLNYCFTPEQKTLHDEIIASGGLIISEYINSSGPKTWTFLKRNRIVAGLGRVLLVIEALERSGSMYTAEYAHKIEREVCAVPGNIFCDTSKGCTQLLKTYANIVSSGLDINNIMHKGKIQLPFEENIEKINLKEGNEKNILRALSISPKTIHEMSDTLSIPIKIIRNIVMLLSLEGYIYEKEGVYHIRT